MKIVVDQKHLGRPLEHLGLVKEVHRFFRKIVILHLVKGADRGFQAPGHCMITPQVSSVQGSKAALQSSSARPGEADGGPCDAPRITSLHFKKLTAGVPFHKRGMAGGGPVKGEGWFGLAQTSFSFCF